MILKMSRKISCSARKIPFALQNICYFGSDMNKNVSYGFFLGRNNSLFVNVFIRFLSKSDKILWFFWMIHEVLRSEWNWKHCFFYQRIFLVGVFNFIQYFRRFNLKSSFGTNSSSQSLLLHVITCSLQFWFFFQTQIPTKPIKNHDSIPNPTAMNRVLKKVPIPTRNLEISVGYSEIWKSRSRPEVGIYVGSSSGKLVFGNRFTPLVAIKFSYVHE